MAKGEYHLAGNPRKWRDDSSWKSCVCTMIILLVIILLILLLWKGLDNSGETGHSSDTLHGTHEHNKSTTAKTTPIYDKTEESSLSSSVTEETVTNHHVHSPEHHKTTKNEFETTTEDRATTLNDHDWHSEAITEEILVTVDSSRELSTDRGFAITEEDTTTPSTTPSTTTPTTTSTTSITEVPIVHYSDSTSVEVSTSSDFSTESATHESVDSTSVEVSTSSDFSTESVTHESVDSTSVEVSTSSDFSTESATHESVDSTAESASETSYTGHSVDPTSESYTEATTSTEIPTTTELLASDSTEKSSTPYEASSEIPTSEIEETTLETSITPLPLTPATITTTSAPVLTSSRTTTDGVVSSTSEVSFSPKPGSKLKGPCPQHCMPCVSTTSCNSSDCKRGASKILSLMSFTANPCNDFYTYACEGISSDYMTEADKEEDVWRRIRSRMKEINDTSHAYLVSFKDYYESCVEDAINTPESTDHYSQTGKIYNIYSKELSKMPTLTKLVTKLLKRDFSILFDVKTYIDKDQKAGIIITPPSYQSLHERIFKNPNTCIIDDEGNRLNDKYDEWNECKRDEFMKMIQETVINANVYKISKASVVVNETASFIKEEMLPIMETLRFTSEINQMYRSKLENITVLTFEQLENETRSAMINSTTGVCEESERINWGIIFEELGIPFDNGTKINIYNWELIKAAFTEIKSFDKRKTHNSFLALYFHTLFKDFIVEQRYVEDRHKYCLKLSSYLMPDVSASIYVESFDRTTIDAENKIYEEQFDALIENLKSEINTANWLYDDAQKSSALEKLRDSLTLHTIDDYTYKIDVLNDRYKDFNRTKNFILNTQQLQTILRRSKCDEFADKIELTSPEIIWTLFSSPLSMEIATVPELDMIVLPFAIIHSQKQYEKLPKYFQMSDLLFKLSKEINYYLQASGFKLFKFANITALPERSSVDLNNNSPPMTIELNLAKSANERVSDTAAAELTVKYYKKFTESIDTSDKNRTLQWLNHNTDQLLYINIAQQFCTKTPISEAYKLIDSNSLHPMIRVNSIASNSPEFQGLFACTLNDTMPGSIRHLTDSTDDYEGEYP